MKHKSNKRLRLPDFIGVGSIRTGTTWLHQQLKGEVGLPLVKETHFFNRYYGRGLSWYSSLFRDAPAGQLVGEFCPTYFPLNSARDRIARDLPSCKVIVTLRDPVERAHSQYKMLRHDGYLPAVSFQDAIKINPGIINYSRYATHLSKWLEGRNRHDLLVCLYDDLLSDEQAYLDGVCNFIGIGRVQTRRFDNKAINAFETEPKNALLARLAVITKQALQSHDYFRTDACLNQLGFFEFCRGRGKKFLPLDSEETDRLREELLPEIEALEKLIGRDLDSWKIPHGSRSSLKRRHG